MSSDRPTIPSKKAIAQSLTQNTIAQPLTKNAIAQSPSQNTITNHLPKSTIAQSLTIKNKIAQSSAEKCDLSINHIKYIL
jgi:hypothetical protein